MVGRKEKEIKPITLAQVKEILEKRAMESEFGYEQQTTLDYVTKFQKLNKEQTQKLIEELLEIHGMTLETAIKIADILPKYKPTLQVILTKDKILLDESMLDRIIGMVSKAYDQAQYSSSKEEIKEKEEGKEEKAKETPEEEKEGEKKQKKPSKQKK